MATPDDDTELETPSLDSPEIDAELRAGFAKLTAGDMEQAAPDAPAAATEATETPTKAERARGPDGKFIEASAAVQAPAATTADAGQTQAAAPAKKLPPTTWKAETKAKWDALPPEVQDEIMRRESDMENGWKELGGRSAQLKEWDQTLAPYMATIQSFGVTPQVAVKEFLAADHVLRYGNQAQKVQMMQKIVQDYGVDPAMLADGYQQVAQNMPPPGDPRVDALVQYITRKEQQEAARANYEAKAQLDNFRNAAPHLDAVREDMAVLLETGRAKDLQEAYDKAVWGKADLRAALIAEQQKKATDEAARIASEARKGAAVNIPVKGRQAAAPTPGSMDDDIREGYRRMTGR